MTPPWQEAATRAKKRHTDLLEIKLRKMAASSDKAHKRATAATAKAAALARRAKTLKVTTLCTPVMLP